MSARRRHMPIGGQTMRVFKCGAGHTQRFGRAIHAPGKGGFGTGDRLADGSCGVIGRFTAAARIK